MKTVRLFLSSNEMAAKRGTVPSLDGLRAISILLVLGAHFISDRVFPGGLGVYIFFVISGFLITRLLIVENADTGGISLPLFYLRRALRLYPVIIAFTICIIAVDIVLGRPYDLIEPVAALGYFSNYLSVYLISHGVERLMPYDVFWSLSVEEHFYILFPLAFLWLRGDPSRLLWAITGLFVVCLGLRLGVVGLHPNNLTAITIYLESQYRLDSIGFGVALALACQLGSGRRLLRSLAHPFATVTSLTIIGACLAVRDPWFRDTLRYTVLGCAIDVLLAGVLFGDTLRLVQWALNTEPLMWLGRLSYSIYIWHEGVASFLPRTGYPAWQMAAISFSATAVAAVVSYYLVEQPFLHLRRYLRTPEPAAILQLDPTTLQAAVGI
jgi:peptidoglycan/LPS O-acetylase OafA/YrhL